MESDGGEREELWTVMNGEVGGVGTDGRGGSAAGPSSSMCALVVWVRALVVLSVGVRYAWVAHRCPWVGVVSC